MRLRRLGGMGMSRPGTLGRKEVELGAGLVVGLKDWRSEENGRQKSVRKTKTKNIGGRSCVVQA
jgi:hypothetical protein